MEKRKSTAVVSFSLDLETLNWLEGYSLTTQMNRSQVIRYVIRMGRTYLQMLDAQTADIAKNGSETG